MIVKSSLRPVSCVIECSCGTSWVRLNPSGVSSNAQEKASASTNPNDHQQDKDSEDPPGAPNDGSRKDAA